VGLALELVDEPSSFSAMTLLVGSSNPSNRLRNDLQCVEWGVKPYYTTPSRHLLVFLLH